MKLIGQREGHPFIDDKVPFNDLEDFAMAMARGGLMDMMTGNHNYTGYFKILSFDFERTYLFETDGGLNMEIELAELISELDEEWEDYYYGDDEEEDEDEDYDDEEEYEDEDDEEDEDDVEYNPNIITLRSRNVFAVMLYRIVNGEHTRKMKVTAIHKKYRQAIQIEKELVRGSSFRIDEIDYDKVDKVLRPVLKEFDLI